MSVNPLHDSINTIRLELDHLEGLADQAMLGTLVVGEQPAEEGAKAKETAKK
jgi:hypothetical protein